MWVQNVHTETKVIFFKHPLTQRFPYFFGHGMLLNTYVLWPLIYQKKVSATRSSGN